MNSNTPDNIGLRRKQLLYRAQHRGFKEADLLIGGFAAACLADMNERELDQFETLIGFPDHDIYDWATGNGEPPAEARGEMLERLRRFDVATTTAPRR